jgi:hypothetical protein
VDQKLRPWRSLQFYPAAHPVAAQRLRFREHKGRRIPVVDSSHAVLVIVGAVAECIKR